MSPGHLTVQIAIIVTAGLAVGCQNQLEVRVQRVVIPTEARLDPGSILAHELREAIDNLQKVKAYCKANQGAADDLEKHFAGALQAYRQELTTTSSGADTRIAKCTAILADPNGGSDKQKIYDTLKDVEKFFADRRRQLRASRKSIEKLPALANLLKGDTSSITATLTPDKRDALAAQAKKANRDMTTLDGAMREGEADAKNIGFGGFVATDIYEVNPSDQAYRRIFRNKVFGIGVDWEPITSAKVGVSGDSSIMVVMEHPGQVGVYQVSNDPTQITQNIALLVSKATAAAAKFVGLAL